MVFDLKSCPESPHINNCNDPGREFEMRYREIVEVVDATAERSKIDDASAQASDASQRYQAALKRSREKADTARRKLATASRPGSPTAPASPG